MKIYILSMEKSYINLQFSFFKRHNSFNLQFFSVKYKCVINQAPYKESLQCLRAVGVHMMYVYIRHLKFNYLWSRHFSTFFYPSSSAFEADKKNFFKVTLFFSPKTSKGQDLYVLASSMRFKIHRHMWKKVGTFYI